MLNIETIANTYGQRFRAANAHEIPKYYKAEARIHTDRFRRAFIPAVCIRANISP